MKFCPYCGQQLEDADVFCPSCGQNTEAVQENVQPEPQFTPASQPQPQPQYQQPQYQVPQYQPAPQYYAPQAGQTGLNPSILALKKAVSSAPSIIAAILFTLGTVLSLALNMMSSAQLSSILSSALYETMKINVSTSSSYVEAILLSIPSFLIILGIWLTIGAAANKNNDRMSTGGLTLIKVIQIIFLVVTCIVFAVLLIAAVILVATTGRIGSSYNSSSPFAAALVSFLLLTGVFVFVLIFNIKVLKTIGSAKSVAATGMPNNKASGFVAVMLFICSVFGIIFSFLFMFISGLMNELVYSITRELNVNVPIYGGIFGNYTFLAGITFLIQSLANLFFGIVIFKVRNAVSRSAYR